MLIGLTVGGLWVNILLFAAAQGSNTLAIVCVRGGDNRVAFWL